MWQALIPLIPFDSIAKGIASLTRPRVVEVPTVNKGAMIGAFVGGSILVGAVGTGVYFYRKHKNDKNRVARVNPNRIKKQKLLMQSSSPVEYQLAMKHEKELKNLD
jgi:hypothetical protein